MKLRDSLDATEEIIAHVGWNKASMGIKCYRHFLIEAIRFIQLKNFDKS